MVCDSVMTFYLLVITNIIPGKKSEIKFQFNIMISCIYNRKKLMKHRQVFQRTVTKVSQMTTTFMTLLLLGPPLDPTLKKNPFKKQLDIQAQQCCMQHFSKMFKSTRLTVSEKYCRQLHGSEKAKRQNNNNNKKQT